MSDTLSNEKLAKLDEWNLKRGEDEIENQWGYDVWDTVDSLIAQAREANALRALIGDAPEGSHPDEWKPRASTWHAERANWVAETTVLHLATSRGEQFKAYVHKRLDDAGVPVDPESPHKAQGCRIGGRLDWVLGRALNPAAFAPLVGAAQNAVDALEGRVHSREALIAVHALRDQLSLARNGAEK